MGLYPILVVLIALSTSVCDVPAARAQAPAATPDGALIAAGRCGRCHSTAAGEEPSPQRGVIPFRRLHERYPVDMLADAVTTGVIAGHDEMPMFELSMDEVRALLAHIDSLAPDRPGYLSRVPALR